MHLSILSDAFVSDRLADAGKRDEDTDHHAQRAHWDGVLRGLVLLGVVATMVALTLMSQVTQSYETTRSSEFEATSPPVTEASAPDRDGMPDDGLVHRLVLRHE